MTTSAAYSSSSRTVTSRCGRTDHAPRRQAMRVPSASRALAGPARGVPHSVATSGRSRVDLLADAFLAARRTDPRLQLALAGGGPEESRLRERLGDSATFLGWLDGEDLARAYASADVFLFASQTDTYGQVIVEAQASGLPVVAVAKGGPASLIDHGQTGMLAPANPEALAGELLRVVCEPLLRERIRRTAIAEVSGRNWETALGQLAASYRAVLGASTHGTGRKVA